MLTESLLQKKDSTQNHGHNFIYVSALPMGKEISSKVREILQDVVFTVDKKPCELKYS